MNKQQKIIIGICLLVLILFPITLEKFLNREILSVGNSYLQIKTDGIYKTIDDGLKIEFGIANNYDEYIGISIKDFYINNTKIEFEDSAYPSKGTRTWDVYISKELLGDNTIDSIESIKISFNVSSLLTTGNLDYDTGKIHIKKELIDSAKTIQETSVEEETAEDEGMTEDEYNKWLEDSRDNFIKYDIEDIEGEEFANAVVEKLGDNAFRITMKAVKRDTCDMIMEMNAENIKKILQALKEGGDLESEDYITICLEGDTIDSNGNEKTGNWIRVAYKGSVIQDMNYDNLMNYQVIKKADSIQLISDLKSGLNDWSNYAFLK